MSKPLWYYSYLKIPTETTRGQRKVSRAELQISSAYDSSSFNLDLGTVRNLRWLVTDQPLHLRTRTMTSFPKVTELAGTRAKPLVFWVHALSTTAYVGSCWVPSENSRPPRTSERDLIRKQGLCRRSYGKYEVTLGRRSNESVLKEKEKSTSTGETTWQWKRTSEWRLCKPRIGGNCQQLEERHRRPPKEPTLPMPGFQSLASRTVSKYSSVVLSTQFVEIC